MSTYHTSFDDMPAAPAANAVAVAFETLRAAAAKLAIGVVRRVEDHRRGEYLGRRSDHLLRDIGFERDWDGSIVPRAEQD